MFRLLMLVCLAELTVGQWGSRTGRHWSGTDGDDVDISVRNGCGNDDIWNGRNDDNDGEDWPVRTSRGRRRSVEIATTEIWRKLIAVGQKMEQFCTAHSDRSLREVYGVEHFQLRVRLSEFTEESIKVRVRQRLVSVHARSCSEEYAAVRILPDIVDAHRALWRLEGGTLTVLFPYNITPNTQLQSRCGREVDESVIIVPQSAAGTVFERDYDVAFGDTNLRRVIRRYLQEMAHEGNINDNSHEYVDERSTNYK